MKVNRLGAFVTLLMPNQTSTNTHNEKWFQAPQKGLSDESRATKVTKSKAVSLSVGYRFGYLNKITFTASIIIFLDMIFNILFWFFIKFKLNCEFS